jgi:hypothetical protein
MVVVNNLALVEVSRLEMFVAMVVWNAIYFKSKLRPSQRICYFITGKQSRKPDSYETSLVRLI